MSKGVGSMMSENGLVPTVPFLRLAAQETRFELISYCSRSIAMNGGVNNVASQARVFRQTNETIFERFKEKVKKYRIYKVLESLYI